MTATAFSGTSGSLLVVLLVLLLMAAVLLVVRLIAKLFGVQVHFRPAWTLGIAAVVVALAVLTLVPAKNGSSTHVTRQTKFIPAPTTTTKP